MTRTRRWAYLLGAIGLVTVLWLSPIGISLSRADQHINSAHAATIPNNTLQYPALGITVPVSYQTSTDPANVAQWGKIAPILKKGVIATTRDSSFNQTKNIIVLGHSSDSYPHPYSAVFAPLYKAKVGDQISLTQNGTAQTFTVTGSQVISPTDTAAIAALYQPSTAVTLRLITCWPLLSARERLVVSATLTQ